LEAGSEEKDMLEDFMELEFLETRREKILKALENILTMFFCRDSSGFISKSVVQINK